MTTLEMHDETSMFAVCRPGFVDLVLADVCRRFAKLGYIAIAPALYARQGEVKDLKDPREINTKIFSKIPDTQSMSDLDAAVAWAAKNSGNT